MRQGLYLVLSDPQHQFPTVTRSSEPFIVLRLDTDDPAATDGKSVQLSSAAPAASTLWTLRDGEPAVRLEPGQVLPIWSGAAIHPELAALLRLSRTAEAGASLVPVPLLLIGVRQGARTVRSSYFACTRVRRSGTSWVRIGEVERASVVLEELIAPGLELLAGERREISSELHQFTNFHKNTEIEVKLTLTTETSPAAVADHFVSLVERDGLPGFVSDLGNELQRWEYSQTTFEILSPDHEKGYMGFVAQADGTYVIRHKTFPQDTLRRREVFHRGIEAEPSGFEGYLAATFPEMRFRRLPAFSRSRFDVNLESTATGHFFGIETDEVVAGDHVMRQVEIEYHKSRRIPCVNPDDIESELFRLQDLVLAELKAIGIEADAGYRSKLSFLRDLVDR
ncbi:hypothetical protein GCM10009789_86350 [Kribbella sancticallisti]|uniref:Uncharacterized protein n=1 Tax=Kribbella sancticallisti TaxID=460087 RepID=A0ABP4QT53_9ACTN